MSNGLRFGLVALTLDERSADDGAPNDDTTTLVECHCGYVYDEALNDECLGAKCVVRREWAAQQPQG